MVSENVVRLYDVIGGVFGVIVYKIDSESSMALNKLSKSFYPTGEVIRSMGVGNRLPTNAPESEDHSFGFN